MDNSQKLKLFIQYISINPIEKCIFPLFNNYKEIETIINQKNQDIMGIIYFNKDIVHKILYEEEKVVYITPHIIKGNKLSGLFYLNLLIIEDINIVNYKYNYDFIREINEYNKTNKPLQKILFSMILILLIDNFKGFMEDDERKIKGIIDSLQNLNINLIEENIYNIKKYSLNIYVNDYKNNKIDEIYAQIINQIIRNYKFENIDNIYEILNQIEIENININDYIFNELILDLDDKNLYINDIKITNKNDFVNIKKITFFYILFKYILKNSIFIYQIPFLFETRKIIIYIIKNDNLKVLNKDKNFNNCKDVLFYIIKTITDSEYYFKLFELNLNGLKINNNVNKKIYKENNNERKRDYDDNNVNEKKRDYDDNNDNEKKRNYDDDNNNEKKRINEECNARTNNNYLTMSNTYNTFDSRSLKKGINNFFKNNKKKYVIIYDFKQFDKNKKFEIIKEENNENPDSINSYKILNFLEEFDEIIKRESGDKLNSPIFLTLIEEDKKNKNNIYNLSCEYYYEKLQTYYRDDNILINGLNQGFQALLCDIIYE